jgi:hypothetical protein
MKPLAWIFIVKIVITMLLWCTPFLFLPESTLAGIGIPEPINIVFIRLLAMSYIALVVGYIFGLKSTLSGGYPIEIIWIGIVSNGGACLLLLTYGFLNTWSSWGFYMQLAMWFSAIATASITLGLVITGLWLE